MTVQHQPEEIPILDQREHTNNNFRLSTLNCKGLPHKVTIVNVIKRQPSALQGAMYLLNTCLYLL
ncbi:hypothetical protein CI733_25100 [Escherichia coli]|nr:hypothetical protein BE963_00095 [Escherichia coli]ASX09227.1 hypothetical protein CA696_029565 [Escherichia coli]ATB85556.1 hypothetical protein CNQ54_24805 [Escherichia coli]OXK49328.1 hypothetical protein CDL37_21375 [Escherichia coli]OXK95515.1 hypothetical protein CD806_26315 [Escherichia coli]